MGQVVTIASAVDKAWDDYAKEAARLTDEPKLCIDRAFMSELVRKEAKFKRLFLVGDRG